MNVWNKQAILDLIETNDRAVWRAIAAIHRRQTAAEQASGHTQVLNGVGFNGVDSEFLSSLAQSYLRFGRLSENQTKFGRKAIKKYWKQLVEIANQTENLKAAA